MIYKEVRGLTRGLQVLRVLNSLPGGVGSVGEIAKLCGQHRTTVKRLLETLRRAEYVSESGREGSYRLTHLTRRLSEGFLNEPWIADIAVPLMNEAVPDLLWPTNLGLPEGASIVVRESTHHLSAMSQHKGMVGEKVPMLLSAIGRAYFCFADETERNALLKLLSKQKNAEGELARDKRQVNRIVAATRKAGYAFAEGLWNRNPEYSGIGVPLLHDGRVIASLNMVYPKKALTKTQLREKYLPRLAGLAAAISARLRGESGDL